MYLESISGAEAETGRGSPPYKSITCIDRDTAIGLILQAILQVCLPFELHDRCLSEPDVATKAMRVENCLDTFKE